jgi:hypothetical protein
VIDGQTVLALWALLAFQVKHLLCDFVLQTKFQVANKGYYGHTGGILHAGCHVLFTVPVLLILTRFIPVIVVIAVCEFAVHYHIDWIKARTNGRAIGAVQIIFTGWHSAPTSFCTR